MHARPCNATAPAEALNVSRSLQTFRRRVLPPSIMSTSAHGETLNALATDGHADHGLSRTGDRVDACLAFPRAAPCPGLYYRRKMNASIGISGKASGGVRLRASATTAWGLPSWTCGAGSSCSRVEFLYYTLVRPRRPRFDAAA